MHLPIQSLIFIFFTGMFICPLAAVELPDSASKSLIRAEQRYNDELLDVVQDLGQDIEKERKKLLKSYAKIEKSLNQKAQKGDAEALSGLKIVMQRIVELNSGGNANVFGIIEAEATSTALSDLPKVAQETERAYDERINLLAGKQAVVLNEATDDLQAGLLQERKRHLKAKLMDQVELIQKISDDLLTKDSSILLSSVLDKAQTLTPVNVAQFGAFRAWQNASAQLQHVQFSWYNDSVRNVIADRQGKTLALCALTPRDDASINNDKVMAIRKGAFIAEGAGPRLSEACKQSHQLSVEAIIRTTDLKQGGPARILSYSLDSSLRNFTVGQDDNRLVLRLRTTLTGENGADPEIELGEIEANQDCHLIISYQPGKLIWWINGTAHSSVEVNGNFSNWDPEHQLIFGDELNDSRKWSGCATKVQKGNLCKVS